MMGKSIRQIWVKRPIITTIGEPIISVLSITYITKTCPCNIQEFFSKEKDDNLLDFFFFNIFLIFAQNIDCGYTLEPPRRAKIRKISFFFFPMKFSIFTAEKKISVYCMGKFS